MNETLNGIAVSGLQHSGSHQVYNNLIRTKLDEYIEITNPNATPQQCYSFVNNLISDIRIWITNNPNTNINNIVLP